MENLRIFVSYSHEDRLVAYQLVAALREAGADVWYDEHNLGAGSLMRSIERELRTRPVFLLLVSQAALNSRWVQDEAQWAYELTRRDPSRVILPVVVAPVSMTDFPLFLESFKRIEASGGKPYPPDEMVQRVMRLLSLVPAPSSPQEPSPQRRSGSIQELIAQGQAFLAHDAFTDAFETFSQATEAAPDSSQTWLGLAQSLVAMRRLDEALSAYDRMLQLVPDSAAAWGGKAEVLSAVGRTAESLAAYDRAIALNPEEPSFWYNRGLMFRGMGRNEGALQDFDHALALDPTLPDVLALKGALLADLGRDQDALEAFDRALFLNDKSVLVRKQQLKLLRKMKLYARLVEACSAALAADPRQSDMLALRGYALWCLRRVEEAAESFGEAMRLDPMSVGDMAKPIRTLVHRLGYT